VSDNYIHRFALILLRNNGHLGQFDVDVLDRKLAEKLYRELLDIGCEVTTSEYTAVLSVTCTPKALAAVEAEREPVVAGTA
jgi:hypothetical protein